MFGTVAKTEQVWEHVTRTLLHGTLSHSVKSFAKQEKQVVAVFLRTNGGWGVMWMRDGVKGVQKLKILQ